MQLLSTIKIKQIFITLILKQAQKYFLDKILDDELKDSIKVSKSHLNDSLGHKRIGRSRLG